MKSFASLRKDRMALGRKGEELAAEYYRNNGFTILARNWRTGAGELDVVARKERDIYFIEVKTLHHKEGFSPAGNLSLRQRRRNFYAGRVFLALLGSPQLTAHFDLVEIEYTPDGAFLSLKRWQDYLPDVKWFPRTAAPAVAEELPQYEVWWKKLLRYLNLFPCPACGKGNGGGAGQLCPDCRSQLKMICQERRCPGCGGNLDGVLAVCSQCLADGSVPMWQGVYSVFEHSGLGRQLVLSFKYDNRTELARVFGKMGADIIIRAGITADVVVPVPAHWRRQLVRGYNQAAFFGRCAAGYLHVPFCDALKRIKSGRRQATLGRTARLKNLKTAFVCTKPEKITGKRVLLVDDVFTTGSTLTAATLQLMKAKAAAVYVLTISRRRALFKNKNVKRMQ